MMSVTLDYCILYSIRIAQYHSKEHLLVLDMSIFAEISYITNLNTRFFKQNNWSQNQFVDPNSSTLYIILLGHIIFTIKRENQNQN